MERTIVINELLNFALCKLKVMPERDLIETVRHYYTKEAIDEALFVLHEAIPINSSTLAARSVRHSDSIRTILSCLKLLPDADRPLFVSKDLNNIPVVKYIKPDIEGEAQLNLRSEQKVMKAQISDVVNDIVCLQADVESFLQDENSFEDEKDIIFIESNCHKKSQKKIKTKLDAIGEIDLVDGYMTELNSEDCSGESIHIQMNFLSQRKKIKIADVVLPAENVIHLDNREGEISLVTHKTFSDVDDSLPNAAKIVVDERKQFKVKNEEKEFFIEVRPDFDASIGYYNYYLCSVCQYSSNDYSTVSKHTCNQFQRIGFACPLCSLELGDLSELNRHLLEHLNINVDDKVFECVQCNAQETVYNNHIEHLKSHSWKVPFNCSSCPFSNNRLLSMRKHVIRAHVEPKVNGKFECHLCGKICPTRPGLSKHKFKHKRKFEFACEFCPITFPNRSARTQHTDSQHLKAKTYICSICSFRCDSNHALKQHKKTHDANHNLSICEVCGISLSSRTSKRNHMNKIHPNVMPYSCEFCEEKFAFRRNYYIHVKNKHKNKTTHKCNTCKSTFRTYGALKKHKVSCHPEPPTTVEADNKQFAIDPFSPSVITWPGYENNLYEVLITGEVIPDDQVCFSSDLDDDLEGLEIT